MKTFEYADDSGALTSGFSLITWLGEQAAANIFTPEAVEDIFTTHNIGGYFYVFIRNRIKSPERPVVLPGRFLASR